MRMTLRLGIHTSTAGSLENAALHAAELGANTFQIFSSSPRMWRARAPDPSQVKLLKAARRRFDLNPLVIHVSYLVNLASADPVIRAKSIAAFRGELERAAAIGAEYLVLHPGSYRGRSVEEGIADFVDALRDAATGFHSSGLTVLLENTAGAGSHLGSRFQELASIRERASDVTDLPIGYCLDTCHLLAAGSDISTPTGLRATVGSAGSLLAKTLTQLCDVVINLPVLKSHFIYGVTACVKSYMGVVSDKLTTKLGASSHRKVGLGAMGTEMVETRFPTLNILDAIWVNAKPAGGPWTPYDCSTWGDVILAGTDPVALDVWAARHVLMVLAKEAGHTKLDLIDPDYHVDKSFGQWLRLAHGEIKKAGYRTTLDEAQMNVFISE